MTELAARPVDLNGSSTRVPEPTRSTQTRVDDGDLTERVRTVRDWLAQPRFEGITRLHTARDVAEQQGSIAVEYGVARDAAEAFHVLLLEQFAAGRAITTFGPYSPGQAVAQKRQGLEAIYLGGWATSAKGSVTEDPGPDLASYPLSQVPDEAASIVRALLAADRNQAFARSRMTAEQRATTPAADFRPFIIADADTGHGGDAHVRNLVRRFVEVGVPGYHIEDQRPGAKKCGHQDGKVLVAQHEQNKRLNAARFQLDVMGVPGIIVARTDAEAASLLDDDSDERDQPFILGATNADVPSFRSGTLAIMELLHGIGLDDVRGHLLFELSTADRDRATTWLDEVGLLGWIRERADAVSVGDADTLVHALVDEIDARYATTWAAEARVMTRDEAIAAAGTAAAQWDPGAARTLEGYYQVQGGIDYAIAKSLAAAPFADLLWMETKTADLADARRFAEAIHAVHPTKMLAYNLSPSFNWDTTGMTDDEMRRFPEELGRLGFVFNFITYGGHQIDGLVAEEFATALQRDGMLALARLQRRLRLLESPYRTPQALVGGDRADAALMAVSGRTAATRAMGVRSTHRQHLAQTEPVPALLEAWLASEAEPAPSGTGWRATIRPGSMGSDQLELRVDGGHGVRVVVRFTTAIDDGDRRVTSIASMSGDEDCPSIVGDLAVLFILLRERADTLLLLAPSSNDAERLERLVDQGLLEPVPEGPAGLAVAIVRGSAVEAAAGKRA
ncbi:MAG: isocitrate lyase [Chloroflexi bacterium]|nr:isocitrate lyase [Chloroflexota bacterium]